MFQLFSVHLADFFTIFFSFFGGGGGGMEEEEQQILKGDEVIVELDASLEDLYMGGSLKVT
jgi:DnaJ homolog subfamily B member 11